MIAVAVAGVKLWVWKGGIMVAVVFFQLAHGGPERRESNKILTRTVKYSRELIFINPKIVLYDAIGIPAVGTLYFTCVLTAKQAS